MSASHEPWGDLRAYCHNESLIPYRLEQIIEALDTSTPEQELAILQYIADIRSEPVAESVDALLDAEASRKAAPVLSALEREGWFGDIEGVATRRRDAATNALKTFYLTPPSDTDEENDYDGYGGYDDEDDFESEFPTSFSMEEMPALSLAAMSWQFGDWPTAIQRASELEEVLRDLAKASLGLFELGTLELEQTPENYYIEDGDTLSVILRGEGFSTDYDQTYAAEADRYELITGEITHHLVQNVLSQVAPGWRLFTWHVCEDEYMYFYIPPAVRPGESRLGPFYDGLDPYF